MLRTGISTMTTIERRVRLASMEATGAAIELREVTRGDQRVLTDTGAGCLVGVSAGTLGDSLKEAGLPPRHMERPQCKK